jgi:hypothetical protein
MSAAAAAEIRRAAKQMNITPTDDHFEEILEHYEELAAEMAELDIKITMSENNRQIRAAVAAAGVPAEICSVLINKYKYVDGIDKLKAGKYIRWINRRGKLSIARFCNIKPTETGMNVLCVAGLSQFITYKFNETMTFQELSDEEKIILWLNDGN